jgi:hypothetical protein
MYTTINQLSRCLIYHFGVDKNNRLILYLFHVFNWRNLNRIQKKQLSRQDVCQSFLLRPFLYVSLNKYTNIQLIAFQTIYVYFSFFELTRYIALERMCCEK